MIACRRTATKGRTAGRAKTSIVDDVHSPFEATVMSAPGLARRPLALAIGVRRCTAAILAIPLLIAACSDDAGVAVDGSADAGLAVCPEASAPPPATDGGSDDHCRSEDGGVRAQPATSCAGDTGDAASDDNDAGADEAYPDPHEGTEADDDDCKFHVKLAADCLVRNQDVTFTMSAVTLTDGAQVTGAEPYIEASLDGLPGPNTSRRTSEQGGVYLIPARFDRAGRWIVRVHLFPLCSDSEDSKHSHVAFYVDVP